MMTSTDDPELTPEEAIASRMPDVDPEETGYRLFGVSGMTAADLAKAFERMAEPGGDDSITLHRER